MRGNQDEKSSDLPIYESHPPNWLPPLLESGDLGYLGFYPPYPKQEEDVLSETNVKNGFVLGHPVSAETFSAHTGINDNINTTASDSLTQLEALLNEAFGRRAKTVPLIPSSSFRMPSRVTLNDAKREAWFADLANPDVPLHKLGKSVPHGAKGHDLLDLLQLNNVAIPRAVWFLRVFGANETAGLRNKPAYNPTQYSVDWANVVTSYMKKQLADIALPSAPRPGLNIKQTFKGVLADSDSRERWILRFAYCLKLLKTFYSEGLVDHRTFLTWLVQQMATCNLAQAGFVASLADEYLDGMLRSRALTRHFLDACVGKLSEMSVLSPLEYLSNTESLLRTLIQRMCIAQPDAFVSPRMWTSYHALLQRVLSGIEAIHQDESSVDHNCDDIQHTLQMNLDDISRRNKALLFRDLPPQTQARLNSAASDVQLLNSITSSTDLDSLPFFEIDSDNSSSFITKLDLLLSWSVTPLQYGDHRPFAAVTLLRNWRDRTGDRASRRDFTSPDEFLQDQLFVWLDSSNVAGESTNISAVALIFGKFVKHEMFSYSNYIQRLIARGEPGLSYVEETGSRHREFIRWIPLHNSSSSSTSQRKVILYGVRARETPEDTSERQLRREIRAILPELFGGVAQECIVSTSQLWSTCPTLESAPRFDQVKTFRQWLLPILRKYINNQEIESTAHPVLVKSYCVTVELMAHTKCFETLLDLTLAALEHSAINDLLTAVINTFHRFMTIWTSMSMSGVICAALYTAHQSWKTRGIQSRALLSLLLEMDIHRHLDLPSCQIIDSDISAFTLALHPESERPDPVPSVLPEILILAGDPHVEAPSLLANSLWFKYRRSSDWAWKVWDNTVASLRQVPVMVSDNIDRRECALRYGDFLLHVDQHTPTGFDDQVLQWFLGPGKSEVAALNGDAWDVFTVVLLYLVVHGALKTTSILRGLIYPAWQRSASVSPGQDHCVQVLLRASNNLFRQLLLQTDGTGDGTPPSDLLELQCILTWRQEAYHGPSFSSLVSNIPVLVILENNKQIPENLRNEAKEIRYSLCKDPRFRQGVFRNLDVVREAFEHSVLPPDDVDEDLNEAVFSALQLALSESHSNVELSSWQDISSLLSPWKLAATTIKLHFSLKQLGRGLARQSESQTAASNLDKLTLSIFRHSITAEQAYFVAEIARGVDCGVAKKFIDNGLRCICEVLNKPPSSLNDLQSCTQRASELLRVLVHITEPLRGHDACLPQLDATVQQDILDVLYAKLSAVEFLFTAESTTKDQLPSITSSTIVLARLLQFCLGFHGSWTNKTKETGSLLSSTIFRSSLLHSAGSSVDLVAFPMLIDTLYYLLDEIPSDIKAAAFDPFYNYPELLPSELPSDVAPEYRRQINSLIPSLLSNASVSHLAKAHRDSLGALVLGTPVLNRPWEWVENLGDGLLLDSKDESKERDEKHRRQVRYLVKNSASLSLDTFGAKVTGDDVLQADDNEHGRVEANIRTFQDGLSADNVFQRDWRETRVELDMDALLASNGGRAKGETLHDGGGTLLQAYIASAKAEKWSTSRASPSSSVLSRASAHPSMSGSTSSMRQSPAQASFSRLSTSTIGESLDVEIISNTSSSSKRGSKRKAANASDDEIEIIEGPLPGPSRGAKKAKAKASAKGRAKKR